MRNDDQVRRYNRGERDFDTRQGGGERSDRDSWSGRDEQYGSGDRSGPESGYGGYEGGYQRGSYGTQRTMPKGYTRSDERIREDVCEHLSRSGLDVSDVSVEVAKGHVTLEGTAKDRRSKHAIEDCADDCTSVQGVDNRIRVQREPPVGSTN